MHRSPILRRGRAVAVLLVLVLLAASCSSDKGGSTATPVTSGKDTKGDGTTKPASGSGFNEAQIEGEPQIGGKITFGVESNLATLDPAGNLAQPSDIVTSLAIYDQLITRDDKGKLAPGLATEWESTDDLKTWTLKLRTGVKFTDGTPFNADAVVKQFTRFKDPATGCSCAPQVADISSIKASDTSTVVFVLAKPNAFFTSTLAGTLGYMTSPTATAKFGKDYARNPVGTGPFILSDYNSLILKKNPDYWRKDDKGRRLPYLDQITVKPIPDARVRLQALESGDVDIIQTADTGTIVDVVKAGKFKLQKVTGSSAVITILNNKKPPFNDQRARLAAAITLNRDELNNVLYQGAKQPAYSPFPPDSPFYADIDWPKFDLVKGKKLIAELKADGVPTNYTVTCIATDEARKGLTNTQAQAKRVGVNIDLEFQDQGAFVNRVLSGSGDYTAGCFRSPQIADADGLYNALHTGGSTNATFYSNKMVDKALDDIRKTTDEKEHIRLLRIVQVQLAKDVPTFPLLYDLFGNIYNDKMSGLPVPEPNALGAIKFAGLYLKK